MKKSSQQRAHFMMWNSSRNGISISERNVKKKVKQHLLIHQSDKQSRTCCDIFSSSTIPIKDGSVIVPCDHFILGAKYDYCTHPRVVL